MTLFLTLAILWVLASSIVAFLPEERQFRPGSLLLLSAPVLIWGLANDFGPLAGIAGLAAFLALYHNPLRALWKLFRGPAKQGTLE